MAVRRSARRLDAPRPLVKTPRMDVRHLPSSLLAGAFRGAFQLRRAERRLRRLLGDRPPAPPQRGQARPGARNILFVTVDQQRFDALGCNGGRVARTPTLDGLAATGLNYQRAHVHNVVCMPSRSTMLTGLHPRTHGVIANGIALPEDTPNVAAWLRERAGYHTALLGKAHFEPHLDPTLRFRENQLAAEGSQGPWRGFDHVELAAHGPLVGQHYGDWIWREHAHVIPGFGGVLTGVGGGDTGAPEVKRNPVDRALYHTDWVAERALAWLGTVPEDAPWFCWLSFPDPHHPFDPPADEAAARVDWRDLDLPAAHPGDPERIEAILRQKPRHWLDWYQGRYRNPEGGPVAFEPARLTHDQIREINALVHVENELIDEALGRVLAWLGARGLLDRTDIVYTSDHGELQGDYGLLFKGPYPVESLLRVPLIWRPAAAAGVAPRRIDAPVGHVDLAPTFCHIAGVPPPDAMQGTTLPVGPDARRERIITTFDSQFAAVGMHLETIYRDGLLCTRYRASTTDVGGRFPLYWAVWGRDSVVPRYTGDEGELYDLRADPHQWTNLWSDPTRRRLRDDLLADLDAHLPPARQPALPVDAPT